MKTTLLLLIAAASAFAAPSFDFKLLDKLGANAKESTNLDLDSSVLKMASGFMKGKDADSIQSLISGLKGIYIRSFEFDRPGKYNEADLEPLRSWLDSEHWHKIIDYPKEEKKEKSSIYVLPLPNDQFGGLAIISVEEQEVTVVFIDGQIDPADIGKLGGNMGIPGYVRPRQPGESGERQSQRQKRVGYASARPAAEITAAVVAENQNRAEAPGGKLMRRVSQVSSPLTGHAPFRASLGGNKIRTRLKAACPDQASRNFVNTTLARKESRKYTVAPTEKGARRRIVSVEGKIRDEQQRNSLLQHPGIPHLKDTDIDGAGAGLIHSPAK